MEELGTISLVRFRSFSLYLGYTGWNLAYLDLSIGF